MLALVVTLKERYDDMVEELLKNEKVNGYECRPEYIGNSFIPCSLTVIAKKWTRSFYRKK